MKSFLIWFHLLLIEVFIISKLYTIFFNRVFVFKNARNYGLLAYIFLWNKFLYLSSLLMVFWWRSGRRERVLTVVGIVLRIYKCFHWRLSFCTLRRCPTGTEGYTGMWLLISTSLFNDRGSPIILSDKLKKNWKYPN